MPKGKSNKRYTPEFKIIVVETMQKEKLSHKEAERQFKLPNGRASAWERIYLEEGTEGLCIERRGHKSTGRPPKFESLFSIFPHVFSVNSANACVEKAHHTSV